MSRSVLAPGLSAVLLMVSAAADARPYASLSGLAATADSAATAGTNPAGMMRFDETAQRVELLAFVSESEWEGQVGEIGMEGTSTSSSETLVPSGYIIKPLNDDFSFSFTILGVGFSDDLGDWPGRYFIQEYNSVNISAYPSIGYRVNDKLSVAGSLSLTYAIYDQERAVANLFDPGFEDGRVELESDGIDVGFGLSALYEYSDSTRFGINYVGEIEPSLDADTKFRGLGPNTEQVLDEAGLLNAEVEINSTTPQSLLVGMYHEFANDHAFTLDLAWVDFSEFQLSEFYFDGESLVETEAEYEDIWAFSAGYSWPINQRWMLGVGGFYASSGVEDDQRTMTFRLDEIYSVGIEAEWQWTDSRRVFFGVSYITLGDAPVDAPDIPLVGRASGEFNSRDTFMFRLGVNFGAL